MPGLRFFLWCSLWACGYSQWCIPLIFLLSGCNVIAMHSNLLARWPTCHIGFDFPFPSRCVCLTNPLSHCKLVINAKVPSHSSLTTLCGVSSFVLSHAGGCSICNKLLPLCLKSVAQKVHGRPDLCCREFAALQLQPSMLESLFKSFALLLNSERARLNINYCVRLVH